MSTAHKKIILRELKIEVTQKCPLNCLHCSSEANASKTQELTLEKVQSIVEEAIELGLQELTISGGEPLVWEPLVDLISYCSIRKIGISVYTTGVIFHSKPELLDKLVQAGLKKVVISLFGSNERIHQSVTRVFGSFNQTIEAISLMSKKELDVKIHFVATAQNFHELRAVALLARSLGALGISVLRFVPHGRGSIVKDIFNLNFEALSALREEIINLRSQVENFVFRVGSPFNILYLNQDVFCLAAIDRAIIGSDHKVFPCDAFKNLDYAGRLISVEDNSLIDVWHESDYLNFVRREIENGMGEVCSACSVSHKCKGGCLAQKLLRIDGGRFTDPDPDCIIQGGRMHGMLQQSK